ncbi:glycosyltransferase [Desulfoferrobacter suflitae]|uniref:glycosyltransferase n=1 Tax=Desulfoferrobacter suflitae TaxID=2865782 RepID=UPI0021640E6D|nr:glycosyltransferase [Desulfoferrobacter suflitae]MCK8603939.1 glycosyltransferase [Desulfoferrobacter suflitae]
MSGAPRAQAEHVFTWVPLSEQERWLSRRTGGLNLYLRIKTLNPDVVQLCSLEQLPLGFVLKALNSCRVVYDCREDMASALFERHKRLPKWLRRGIFSGVRVLESLAARQFDGIITADPGVYELFSAMPAERRVICYNAALLKQFPANYPPIKERKYDVAVLGSMSSLRSGTQDVLDALAVLSEKGMAIRLLLIGQPENEMEKEIDRRIHKYGLEGRVYCTGLLSHSDVPAVLAQARVGVVPLLDYPKFHRNIACKAFEYMACGMPTIASDLPPQRLFLTPEISSMYPPGDVQALAKAMRNMLSDHDRIAQMGDLARASVQAEWNGEREQEKLRRFYAQLLQLPPRSVRR